MEDCPVIIVMGVSGAGKTAVGKALAAHLAWTFYDADDYHSAAAKAKMGRGAGLTDTDRAPWLGRIRALVTQHLVTQHRASGSGAVIACSALKASYRRILAEPGERVRFLWLDVPAAVLRDRLAERESHFADASLLPSQLAALEAPAGRQTVRIDGAQPFVDVVEAALKAAQDG